MSKPRKGIHQAIKEQDEKLNTMLQAHLSMDDYHKVLEQINIVVDLNVHAVELAFKSAKADIIVQDEVRQLTDAG